MTFDRKLRDEARAVPPKYPAARLRRLYAAELDGDLLVGPGRRAAQAGDAEELQEERDARGRLLRFLASDSEEDEDGVEEYPFLDAPLAPPRERGEAQRGCTRRPGRGRPEDEGGEGGTSYPVPALEGKAPGGAGRGAALFEVEQRKRKERRLAARDGSAAAAAAAAAAEAEEEEACRRTWGTPAPSSQRRCGRDEEERGARRKQERGGAGARDVGARDVGGAGDGSSSAADAAKEQRGARARGAGPTT